MSDTENAAQAGSPAVDTDGGASRAKGGQVKHTVTARTKARRRAVEILFEADQRGLLRVNNAQDARQYEDRDARAGYDRDFRSREEREREIEDRMNREDWYLVEDADDTALSEPDDEREPAERLREFAAERAVHSANHTEAPAYAREVLTGVADHLAEVDDTIETYAQGWTLSRMPAVDRAIARVATWEIVWNDDVDAPVAVDEAMTLARMLSTDESPRYLNGLLGRIGDLADTLR